MRPRTYHPDSIRFSNTYYLGILTVFLLALEFITGIFLTVYYVPTPEGAYESIVRLKTEVPFGWMIRNLHRIGGEIMIVAVVLHLIRVFLSDAYKGKARFTWISGIALLLSTLMLAFSGYLLPWDQRSFWAVTIGTSIADTIPVVGRFITELLRGGAEFGREGLLRFYLLHIVGIPILTAVFFGMHYYRVSRLHGISLPVGATKQNSERGAGGGKVRVPLFPTITLLELVLSFLMLAVLILTVTFFYDAPLGYHADPRHTPSAIKAPWFFLWLQGALKLGDGFLMAVCLPAALLFLLALIPYLDRRDRRILRERPLAMILLPTVLIALMVLSVMGLSQYGIQSSPIAAIFQEIAPEEERSSYHDIGYDHLPLGIYEGADAGKGVKGKLGILLTDFSSDIKKLTDYGTIVDSKAIVIIEDWQAGLKKITIRVTWRENQQLDKPLSQEKIVFVHRLSKSQRVAQEQSEQ